MTPSLFSQLHLPPAQLANLASLGYEQMTPVQAEVFPHALKGADIIAQAKTGSGKTAAFGIPLIAKLDLQQAGTQALILCPTRELGLQVSGEIRKLARYLNNIKVVTLYGGQKIALQKSTLQGGAHVLVGTPGRIKDHLSQGTISLGTIRTLVLDEADRMLEMGFLEDITGIIGATPAARQTFLCSATLPENIRALSARLQRNPVHIRTEAGTGTGAGPAGIDHQFILCDSNRKLEGLAALLSHFQPVSALVFCDTKIATKEVFQFLSGKGFSAAALHGDLEQREREQVLMRFRHRSIRVLVATDVAARGLDIEDLPMVLNFEVPQDADAYVHRTGRTGRAGKSGLALTLASPGEHWKIQGIQNSRKTPIPSETLDAVAGRGQGVLLSDRVTLDIAGGRKDKLRPGDILGALTGEKGIDGRAVGKIDVMDYAAYVSVDRKSAPAAFARLCENKIKGRKFRVRVLE